jgi:hypothetical protein
VKSHAINLVNFVLRPRAALIFPARVGLCLCARDVSLRVRCRSDPPHGAITCYSAAVTSRFRYVISWYRMAVGG